MTHFRIIPTLLLADSGFYKTKKFKDPTYLGDPVNIIRIFNDKEVDEICILDIKATPNNKEPNYALLAEIANECFVPLSYGGGITSIDQADKLFTIGFEKVVLNSIVHTNPNIVREFSNRFGSQSVVVSIDVKRNFFGNTTTRYRSGTLKGSLSAIEIAKLVSENGAGEIIINSIDREGTFAGYDLDLISSISNAVSIPVVALGGAATPDDFQKAIEQGGASAVAAGSMFVFQGKHNAVLISYPQRTYQRPLPYQK